MCAFVHFYKTINVAILFVLLCGTAAAATSQVQTNRSERWVTNLVEVKMQATRLVTEYRTNWVEDGWTTIIDVYATNRIAKFYTNKITVDVAHTNFVQMYQTNLKTLRLTNWISVLQFKTNWVNQPVTNVVTIDLPAPRTSASPNQNQAGTAPHDAGAAPAASSQLMALQAHRGPQPSTGKPAEVQLTVHSTDASLQIQQWRVERDDGSILLFGQGPEFRRPLPVGKYKVEVKARQPGTNQMLAALGTLSVLPSDVLIQQKAPSKWVSP